MLKPDGDRLQDDITWFMDTTGERGGIVSIVTGGSGGYPGNRKRVVSYKADPSGAKPIGVLMQDVLDFDTNRQHENWEKGGFVARKGDKVFLLRKGWVTTNMISGNPAAGDSAYAAASGMISPTQAPGAPLIGRFESAKDQDGYAKFAVEIL